MQPRTEPIRLVLGSASPARRQLLQSAGLRPEVIVSHADETGTDHLPAAEAVIVLARRKGRAVADGIGRDPSGPAGSLVVACDSLLEFEGETWGKASSADEVRARWVRLRGRTGRLHTGHFLLDVGSGTEVEETDTALIRFGCPSDAEIDAYAGTEESSRVAGPFTLEGRSAPWIDGIDGNYGTVVGISLAVLARLLARLGYRITDLWV